ncbi:MAG TPA: heme biosynthesis HemY N-terminal domain-containing protein [Gammaproteobacteria bacterium]|nr:heme biosynthesis HemY N-terminal domain-containing protein [Gammaproteobacteria bacterium]
MRRFVLFIVIFILSVWLGLRVAKDPGLVLITYHHWSAEMPLWFAIVAFIAVMVALYFMVRLIDGVDNSFYRWRNWLRWRRKNKAYSKTNRGLLELIEGRWRHAENDLLEGIDQSDAPLINYLAAAKAAHERGAYDKRDMYLHQAHDLAPQADMAIGLTQAQLQFNQGQLEQALATLHHLRTVSPLQPVVLKLLEKLYVRLADWKNLLKLLPSLRRAKIFTLEQMDQLEQKVYQELLNAAANKPDGLKNCRELWATLPRRMEKNPQVVSHYVQYLVSYPDAAEEALELINRTVKKTWESDLVKFYGEIMGRDPKKQLAQAEKWLKLYPHQAVLFLTLGRLCLDCQVWGKARSYLDDSLKLAAMPETYMAYGKLFEALDDMASAAKYYREGLLLASER